RHAGYAAQALTAELFDRRDHKEHRETAFVFYALFAVENVFVLFVSLCKKSFRVFRVFRGSTSVFVSFPVQYPETNFLLSQIPGSASFSLFALFAVLCG